MDAAVTTLPKQGLRFLQLEYEPDGQAFVAVFLPKREKPSAARAPWASDTADAAGTTNCSAGKALAVFGAPADTFHIDGLEFFGRVNLMKGAVLFSDGASTVSPSYAREVTNDPDLGFGMEGVACWRSPNFAASTRAATTSWPRSSGPT